jgi:hypothetical protein
MTLRPVAWLLSLAAAFAGSSDACAKRKALPLVNGRLDLLDNTVAGPGGGTVRHGDTVVALNLKPGESRRLGAFQ